MEKTNVIADGQANVTADGQQRGGTGNPGRLITDITAGLGGLTSMLTFSNGNAQVGDTSQQWGAIGGLNSVGRGNYNSFGQIAADSVDLQSVQPDLGYDTIRGGSAGQHAGNTLSSAMSGAAAGAKVGGVYGAIGGAVLGLGKGAIDWVGGNSLAKSEQSILRSTRNTEQALAQQRVNNAADSLANANFGNAYANRAARGGQLRRNTMNIRDFADAVLARKRESDRTHSAGIVRTHCNGGTMIRIKR